MEPRPTLDGSFSSDADALASADAVDGTLLVGADGNVGGLEDRIERFRDEPA
ncbi:hypothetical protein AB7C87_08980 [Natrarchaeobius sp. A-rgal3]|uniref:hypothetical protein n=1 Tax=Natrarchaeobius versutus TaxID=1679078 RepID=UPI00350FDEE4